MKKNFIACMALALFSCSNAKKEQATTNIVETQEDGKEFSKNLTWNETKFEIGFKNDTLTIVSSGLEIVNDTYIHPLEGVSVTDAQIADLNGDGHAEVLVYLTSDGSGSYGDIVAYSVNNGKSMSQIYYTTENDGEAITAGYMGHDRFAVRNDVFTRSFSVYNENDNHANPTGGTRILLYKLIDGETGRKLVVDKIEGIL